MIEPTLTQLANHFGSDKGTIHGDRHNYTAVYDLIFHRFKFSPIHFLEIGLARGGPENPGVSRTAASQSPSVAMWMHYFPLATIYGFDITDFSAIEHPRFRFIHGDASNSADLAKLAAAAPRYHLIVDDGSHASPHQQLTFKHLFPRLAPGGIYVIEVLHWQSPVFEALIPGTPKTAEAFAALYERGVYLPNPILSEAELAAAKEETAVYSMLPGLNGAPSGAKLLILQKKM